MSVAVMMGGAACSPAADEAAEGLRPGTAAIASGSNAGVPMPFCSLSANAPNTAFNAGSDNANVRLSYWSASEVQRQILAQLKSEPFGCTPHSAYLAAYARMTKDRDKARCDASPTNAMHPSDPLDARLNDALADMMTRNYLQIANACVSNKEVSRGADVRSSRTQALQGAFCDLHVRANQENWNTLRVAMGSTAYYLSTHLAVALSALAHTDDLWVGTDFDTVPKRVERMRAPSFKKVYDAFNGFLGNSLTTVGQALEDAGLMRNADRLKAASKLAELGSPAGVVFGNRRDVAYKLGLAIAELVPLRSHPWTQEGADGRMHMRENIVQAPAFPVTKPGASALQQHLDDVAAEGAKLAAALANPFMQAFGNDTVTTLDAEACRAKMGSF